MPNKVEDTIIRIKDEWPQVDHFSLHMHNGRNMALPSIYAAMRVLDPKDTLDLDGSIGGFGGCPYCGNGQATGLAPTEDLLHMMDGMGIETGVNLDKLIDCVWLAEEILSKPLYGHVSKAGPRPYTIDKLYDINAPFIETLEQAKHFKTGPDAYKGGISPYKEPISSPYRDRVESGKPPYESAMGEWPWKESWIPSVD